MCCTIWPGKFDSTDGSGPTCVRRFVEETNALGDRSPEQRQQDAFGQVDSWLRALGLRGWKEDHPVSGDRGEYAIGLLENQVVPYDAIGWRYRRKRLSTLERVLHHPEPPSGKGF